MYKKINFSFKKSILIIGLPLVISSPFLISSCATDSAPSKLMNQLKDDFNNGKVHIDLKDKPNTNSINISSFFSKEGTNLGDEKFEFFGFEDYEGKVEHEIVIEFPTFFKEDNKQQDDLLIHVDFKLTDPNFFDPNNYKLSFTKKFSELEIKNTNDEIITLEPYYNEEKYSTAFKTFIDINKGSFSSFFEDKNLIAPDLGEDKKVNSFLKTSEINQGVFGGKQSNIIVIVPSSNYNDQQIDLNIKINNSPDSATDNGSFKFASINNNSFIKEKGN